MILFDKEMIINKMVGDFSPEETVSMRTNNLGHRIKIHAEDVLKTLIKNKGYFAGIDGRWENEDLSHAIEIFILRDEYLCDKYDAMMRCLSS